MVTSMRWTIADVAVLPNLREDCRYELIDSPGTKNIRRDREAKMDHYARWGVLEYWTLDWRLRRMEVYRRQETQWRVVGTLP